MLASSTDSLLTTCRFLASLLAKSVTVGPPSQAAVKVLGEWGVFPQHSGGRSDSLGVFPHFNKGNSALQKDGRICSFGICSFEICSALGEL